MGDRYTPQYQYVSPSYVSSVANPTKTAKKPYNMSITGDIFTDSRLMSVDSKTHKIKLSSMERNSAHFEIQELRRIE